MGSISGSIEGPPPSGVTTFGGRPSGTGPADDGDSTDRVLVGLITRPHGIRGEVKVEIWSDVPGRFDSGRELLRLAKGRSTREVRIASSRLTRGGAIVRFDGCQTREQAESLRGSQLAVPRSEVPDAPEGRYYHFDLVGCRCIDAALGNLGEVTEVVEDGGGVLLEVVKDGRVLSVPFVEAFLESVDVAAKQIRLRLPSGLVETCASES